MHKTVEKLRRELGVAVAGLSVEDTQARREAGKWSVQQIVEHLLLSYKTTEEVVLVRVAKGTATKAKPMVSQRLGQFMIVKLGIFPEGRKAPEAVSPKEPAAYRLSGDELADEVSRSLSRMDGALTEAEKLFGSRRAISHLVLGPMSVGQWREFHLVHGKHHIRQIQATCHAKAQGRPRSTDS